MSPRIQILPPHLADRIAAGEVVERPASVVKELVENALDAGARRIDVIVKGASTDWIEVVDDGCGMEERDARLSLTRHATSKIKEPQDLENILTLGFRGEALASIAAVADVVLETAPEEGGAGTRLFSDEEGVRSEALARAHGTRIVVKKLFGRTPARLNFLKSEKTEFSKIAGGVTRLALSNANVRFRLLHDEKEIFASDGRGDVRSVLARAWGLETAKSLLEIDGRGDHMSVKGFVAPPHLNRGTRQFILPYVNGRAVEDRVIQHAVAKAYDGIITPGRFPLAVLFLSIDASLVDVNVHPAKAEVRFKDSNRIHRLVQQAVRIPLQSTQPMPTDSSYAAEGMREFQRGRSSSWGGARESFVRRGESFSSASSAGVQRILGFSRQTQDQAAESAQEWKPLSSPQSGLVGTLAYRGQLMDRYLLAEDEEGLVILDQHALHERILFDRLKDQFESNSVEVQLLLVPAEVEATPAEMKLLEERKEELTRLGFDVEPFSPSSIVVRSVPAVFREQLSETRAIRAILDEYLEGGNAPKGLDDVDRLASAACRSAVKFGQTLHEEEAAALLRELMQTTNPLTCPHGRPTMFRMTMDELDRRFGRL